MSENRTSHMTIAEFADLYRPLHPLVSMDLSTTPDVIAIAASHVAMPLGVTGLLNDADAVKRMYPAPGRITVLALKAIERDLMRADAFAKLRVIDHDIVDDRFEVQIDGWTDGDVIHWRRDDVRGNLVGPYAHPGWASRCLDPSTGLWETCRLSRRAARRQRGRARAARRHALAAPGAPQAS